MASREPEFYRRDHKLPHMSAIRPFLSALIVGVSVWAAAGDLTVATPDSPAVRLAVPASIGWFIGPALLAVLIPAWRRQPALAAPALVATLPWWPVPVPGAFLVWTGPMAWVPIGLAAVLALAAGHAGARRAGNASFSGAARHAGLAAALTLAFGVATAVAVDSRTPGGDEPHYLVITQSLLRDGDLRIENNHIERQYAEYFGGTIAPDFIQRGADGEIYSIHAPGVSALVLPAFAAFGYRGAQATILALSAITGALVWLIGWHATGRRDAAWFAWSAVALTPTLLLQSSMVFPDGPAALGVATAVWLLMRLDRREPVSAPALFAVGALLAGLPWLHTRFSLLSAGFGLIIAAYLFADRESRVRRLGVFLAVPVVAAVTWFGFFWLVYGTVSPAAPYGTDSGARLAYVPGGALALLFDQQFGLLTYSPVLAGAAYGLATARRWNRGIVMWSVIAVGAVYVMAVATYWMWWAGVPATPARFLTAIIPVAALPLAVAWVSGGSRARLVLTTWLIVSLGISVITVGVGDGSLAWNSRNAEAQWLEWLGPVANLPRAWPSFFWRLSPDDLATELPFALHVAVFVLILSAGTFVGVRWGRPAASEAPASVLGLAWALPLSLMLVSAAGWRLSGVDGLDPTRSQLGVLAAAGRGGLVWRIEPGGVGRDFDLRVMRIHGEEPGRTDAPPPWMALADVPPGQFDLEIESRGAAGRAVVRIGRSLTPVVTAPLVDGVQRLPVSLPAGARALVVEGENDGGVRVALLPIGLTAPVEPPARSFERYGGVEVFFLNDAVFVERSGFWVRGRSEADFILAASAGEPVSLLVQNGGAPNTVVVRTDGRTETLTLEPSEERTLPANLAAQGAAVRVQVSSSDGFRPSDVSQSEDRRFLGVWIGIR